VTAADQDTVQQLQQLQGDSLSLLVSLLSQAPFLNSKPLLGAWGNGPTPLRDISLTINALKVLMCSDTGGTEAGTEGHISPARRWSVAAQQGLAFS